MTTRTTGLANSTEVRGDIHGLRPVIVMSGAAICRKSSQNSPIKFKDRAMITMCQ